MKSDKVKIKREERTLNLPFAFSSYVNGEKLVIGLNSSPPKFYTLKNIKKNLKIYLSKIAVEYIKKVYGEFYFIRNKIADLPLEWRESILFLKQNGFITRYHFRPVYTDEPQVFRICLEWDVNSFQGDGLQPQHNVFSQSVSQYFNEAMIETVGEFLERFPLLGYERKNLTKGSFVELLEKDLNPLDISNCALHSVEGGMLSEAEVFDKTHSEFLWVQANELTKSEMAYIPAQFAFWNFNMDHTSWCEPLLREPNTSGAAGHGTYNKAVLVGLLELINRDGLLAFWINKRSPERILPDVVYNLKLRRLLKDCSRYNLEVYFLDVTTDIEIASVICVISDRTSIGGRFALGGAAGFEWEEVLYSSLREALSTHIWLRELIQQGEELPFVSNEKDIINHDWNVRTRVMLWGNCLMEEEFNFFISGNVKQLSDIGKRKCNMHTTDEQLKYVIDDFTHKGKGYEIYVYEAYHDILKYFGTHTVKVVVPNLIPLYLKESKVINSTRLEEFSKKNKVCEIIYNPWPHPFP